MYKIKFLILCSFDGLLLNVFLTCFLYTIFLRTVLLCIYDKQLMPAPASALNPSAHYDLLVSLENSSGRGLVSGRLPSGGEALEAYLWAVLLACQQCGALLYRGSLCLPFVVCPPFTCWNVGIIFFQVLHIKKLKLKILIFWPSLCLI